MPCDYSTYDPRWKEIVAEKKRKHNNKCEMCYAPNGETVYRYGSKSPLPWTFKPMSFEIEELPGGLRDWKAVEGKPVKIVLTVHHIDGDKTNNEDSNLLLCCQKDHLRLEIPLKKKKRSGNNFTPDGQIDIHDSQR